MRTSDGAGRARFPRPSSISAWSIGAILWAAVGCGQVSERLIVTFPDARVRAVTTQIAVTAFDPIFEVDNALGFSPCESTGVFPPVATVSPGEVASQGGFGPVFLDREAFDFEDGFDQGVSFPKPTSTPRNPWGAVQVVVEARGDALVAASQGGGSRIATLASACYCVRTLDGSHPDLELDAEVKRACAPIERELAEERTVELAPVVPREFRLEPCHTDRITGPAGSTISPGPTACVRTTTCQNAPGSLNCFDCRDTSCTELQTLSNVPIMFEVEGGGITPSRSVAITGASGAAQATLGAEACSGPFEVVARILGRTDETVRFRGDCVNPVGPLRCADELDLGAPVNGLTTLPSPLGGPDLVAVVQPAGDDDAVVRVLDPTTRTLVAEVTIPDEEPEAILGFDYDIGGGRPHLAVATSREVGGTIRNALWLRLFEWDGATLTETATLTEPCGKWSCGSLSSCASGCGPTEECLAEDGVCVQTADREPGCPEGPAGCECRIEVNFGAKVTLTTADMDGDGRADLAAASSASVPVVIWYSGQASPGRAYAGQGCRCGRYGTLPGDFTLASVGGAEEPALPRIPDLLLASSGGGEVVYGRPTSGVSALQCGSADNFGQIVTTIDLATGRFACQPALDPSCSPYDDVVVVATPDGATGAFDDFGYLRVVFGSDRDLAAYADVFDVARTFVDLIPRRGGRAPNDPVRASVGDLNGDGHDDVAVLFDASQQIRAWLGRSNRGLGELPEAVDISACERSLLPDSECRPLDALALPDLDDDGRAEMVVVCDPSNASARLRWYSPSSAR